MLTQSRYSRAISANLGQIQRRLRSLEERLEPARGRAAVTTPHTAGLLEETIASAVSSIADRFRSGRPSVTDGTNIGGEAIKLGNEALRRIAQEVEHRPLMTLAVAIGAGILVGLVSHRR